MGTNEQDEELGKAIVSYRVMCDSDFDDMKHGALTMAEYHQSIDARLERVIRLLAQHTKEAERRARIDELQRLDTRRHYGKDYQDSLDELDEYKCQRLAELSASPTNLSDELDKLVEEYGIGIAVCAACKHDVYSHYWNGAGNGENSGWDSCHAKDCNCKGEWSEPEPNTIDSCDWLKREFVPDAGFKAAITAAYAEAIDAIIGEDESEYRVVDTEYADPKRHRQINGNNVVRNSLRAEQRQRLQRLLPTNGSDGGSAGE